MRIIQCPHCFDYVLIEDIGCGIFRHGYDKEFKQVCPNASRYVCEINTFYGCGKPFRIIADEVVKCQYL